MIYAQLLIAIAFEVVATSALKATDGFTRFWPAVVTVVGYGVAFYFLSLTLAHDPGGHRLRRLVGRRHRADRGDRLGLVPPEPRRRRR